MKCLLLVFILALSCVGCIGFNTFPSPDCTGAAPAGFTRIFVGKPSSTGSQSGLSIHDPLDGTTAEKFDRILRTISAGEFPTWGAQKNISPENLVVCVASGTFQTNGFSHLVPGDPKADQQAALRSDIGFAVGKNWKIHGQGAGQTRLKLVSYLGQQFVAADGSVVNGGSNVVISTNSLDASGVEISDLTIDGNHDGMTSLGGTPLNLNAIILRSVNGGDWIHNVEVRGSSGDGGFLNVVYESFAVQLWGEISASGGSESQNNLIEHVTVHKPGKGVLGGEFAGGKMDGIVVTNASAEVRNNRVEKTFIAYSGWLMQGVNFHDNVAQDVGYGFNADSFDNTGVTLQSNQIIHPAFYGVVLGGGRPEDVFSHLIIADNTIVLGASYSAGLVLRGHVRDSAFSDNIFSSDRPVQNAYAILSLQIANGFANFNNVFELNKVDRMLRFDFTQDPNFNSNCRYLNTDLQGNAIQAFGDNTATPCSIGP